MALAFGAFLGFFIYIPGPSVSRTLGALGSGLWALAFGLWAFGLRALGCCLRAFGLWAVAVALLPFVFWAFIYIYTPGPFVSRTFGLWPLGFGLWALGLWKGRQAPSTKHQAPHKTLHKTLQTKKFLPLRGQQEHKLGTLKALLSCQLFFVNVL